MKLPKTSDLAKLPHWALVAFGARCARRLDQRICILDEQGQLATSNAIRLAEQSATNAKALDVDEAVRAARAAEAREWHNVSNGGDSTDDAVEFSAPAAVAALAAQIVKEPEPHTKVRQIIDKVTYATLNEEDTKGILRDFRLIVQAAIDHKWNDNSAVTPHFFATEQDSVDLVSQAVRSLSDRLALLVSEDPRALDAIEWRDLERMLANVFDGLGLEVELTPASKDGGKDLILSYWHSGNRKQYIVEVKHWRSGKRVGKKELTNFVHVVAREKRDGGLFLSTYGYSDDEIEVITEIERDEVFLGEKPQIVALCRSYMRANSGLWSSTTPFHEVLHRDFKQLALNYCKDLTTLN